MADTIQPSIHKRIANIMKDVDFIKKDRKNQSQGYNFRGIDDIYNALHKIFADHGVFIASDITNTRREERINAKGTLLIWTIVDACFTFFAEDGSCIKTTMVGEAMDSGDKGCNKAMSAALKYALMQMLLIPTEEVKDTETETHELSPKTEIRKKTLISDNQFQQAIERIKANDEYSQGVYDKTIQYFDLSEAQRSELDELNSRNTYKKTA